MCALSPLTESTVWVQHKCRESLLGDQFYNVVKCTLPNIAKLFFFSGIFYNHINRITSLYQRTFTLFMILYQYPIITGVPLLEQLATPFQFQVCCLQILFLLKIIQYYVYWYMHD